MYTESQKEVNSSQRRYDQAGQDMKEWRHNPVHQDETHQNLSFLDFSICFEVLDSQENRLKLYQCPAQKKLNNPVI